MNLAHALRGLGADHIAFVGDFGSFARRALEARGFRIIDCQEDQPTPQSLLDHLPPEALVVIDHYGVDAEFIDALAQAQRRPVYFVDEDRYNFAGRALALISIRLEGQEMRLERFQVPVLSGADYLIVSPEFAGLRAQLEGQAVRQRVEHVTVFLSGTQGQFVREQLLVRALGQVTSPPSLHLITHHAQAHQEHTRPRFGEQLSLEAPTPQLASRLAQTDLLICGGGLLKYEAAYCGIPSAICSVTELQHHDTRAFCAQGLAYDLGAWSQPGFEDQLVTQLTALIDDQRLRQRLREQCHGRFRSDSTQRLANRLVTLHTEGVHHGRQSTL